jgi:ParB family transcriptional regulator, chromosome partitioning protein
MSERSDRRILKRGLSALMAEMSGTGDGASSSSDDALRLLPIDLLAPSASQPRKDFRPEALEELADSIRQRGVIQPIIARAVAGGTRFEIVAGERRWRAAAMAGMTEVPTVVRNLDDAETLQVAIVENVQRADLNPLEEAAAYGQLGERFGHTQEEIASALGKSRSHVANTLRLLKLPQEVQNQLASGLLSAGHARALLSASDPVALGAIVVGRGLTVRQTEELVRRSAVTAPRRRTRPEKDADTSAIEADLTASLKMTVRIDHGAAGEGGTVSIRYRTLDDLDFLCRVLASAERDTVL